MRTLHLLLLAAIATPIVAEDLNPLTGEGLSAALVNAHVVYENGHRQSFYDDGSTEYSSGSQPSSGNWRIEDDSYCSQWPPQESWDCYVVTISEDGSVIEFIGEHGDRYPGRIKR